MGKKPSNKNKPDDSRVHAANQAAVYHGPQLRKKFHVKDLLKIQPATSNQSKVFHTWRKFADKSFFLCGSAGTGKTFCAMYLALSEVLDPEALDFDRVIIVRSVVPSREIGFLPGSMEEKTMVYEEPYASICDEIFPFNNAYENLKTLGYIDFVPTSFLRGTTFNNSIIIVDECQNMTYQELDTIITRAGECSKIIFCGDIKQNDLNKTSRDVSGFDSFHQVIVNMTEDFEIIEFNHDDIVRSGLVKRYIIAKEKQGF